MYFVPLLVTVLLSGITLLSNHHAEEERAGCFDYCVPAYVYFSFTCGLVTFLLSDSVIATLPSFNYQSSR